MSAKKTGGFQLDPSQAMLVVVDVQERLVTSMPQDVYHRTLRTIDFLVKSAGILEVPVIVTEQYPRGLGHTVSDLAAACREAAVEKLSFGCCGEPAFLERLRQTGRSQVILVGMEAHVCVYQTLLGLLDEGCAVHLVRDGVISRGKVDYLNALDLAAAAGAVVTTAETAVFQLLGVAGSPEFKAVSGLVKERFSQS